MLPFSASERGNQSYGTLFERIAECSCRLVRPTPACNDIGMSARSPAVRETIGAGVGRLDAGIPIEDCQIDTHMLGNLRITPRMRRLATTRPVEGWQPAQTHMATFDSPPSRKAGGGMRKKLATLATLPPPGDEKRYRGTVGTPKNVPKHPPHFGSAYRASIACFAALTKRASASS